MAECSHNEVQYSNVIQRVFSMKNKGSVLFSSVCRIISTISKPTEFEAFTLMRYNVEAFKPVKTCSYSLAAEESAKSVYESVVWK